MIYSYGYDFTYMIGNLLIIVALVITIWAQVLVNSRYSKYKKCDNDRNVTGFDTARRILDENGLNDIDIVEVNGNLSDHYDPSRKVVRLSHDIYSGTSVASVAVAAHECGHAIQDKDGYVFLKIRNMIVPTVNLCSKLGYIVIFLGLIFGYFNLAIFGFILLCAILVFQLVTLPVEFNASKRAKEEIMRYGIIDDAGQDGVSKMLFAAAMTYVASVASTLLQLLRMLLIILNGRNRD